jgi:amino acid adenylation domain-containing protein
MLTAVTSEPMKPAPHTPINQTAPSDADGGVLAFPASVAQQMFWYLELLQGEVTAFNVPLRFRLTGLLDVGLLERALNTVIERHESLRTRFEENKGELLQVVNPELVLKIPVIDISHLSADRIEEEAERLGSIEARRAFHLATGPMIRAELVRFSAESHILHITLHHSLFDGMSMTVLTSELAVIYQAYFDGKPCPLEPLQIQYGDFSVWQKEFLEGPEMKRQLAYWKKRLDGMTELDLPTDFPRPPVKTWKGEIISTLLPKDLTDRLQAIAARHGATLFHLQLAAYMILLHRYTGSLDVAVGTPVTGRTRGELEPLIGVFINSLILRCDLSGNPGFSGLLGHVRETALEALENQELPFECLVRELRPERDQSRNPLFQVNFNHHRSFAMAGTFGGVTLTPIPSRSPGTIFDLHFFMVERKEGWRASCDYCTDLFTRTSAERMLGHFKRLLEDIAEHPEKPIEQLEILSDHEQEQLRIWSGHSSDYPRDATIGGLFLETAGRFPERIALDCGEHSHTYQELRTKATQVAAGLIEAGVKPGDIVAIAARPGPEMIAGFLGILLAGGCCAPIDPAYPADRFAMLLEESGARTALATTGCDDAFPSTWTGKLRMIGAFDSAAAPAELPEVLVTADHPAHLLFTSGSTGRPKGLLLPHRGSVRLVRGNDFITITPDDVFLQAAPASFDASLLEIWGALLNGGRLVLLPNGPGLEDIASAVRDKGVTTLWLTSGLFQLMIDENPGALKGLLNLLAGGDVLSPSHVRKALEALPGTRLINGYGPTENSTFTTCREITVEDCSKPSIPIGKPIANTTVYLLDDHLRRVPVGIPGELCSGGDGLAIGYLNAPELTAEKFIQHPDLGRLYRTGDLCRLATDGTIEFIGRRDHQVKVRGFRIELGEIEAVLASHPQVRQTKAAVRGDSAETKRILAWVVAGEGQAPTPEELSAYLAARLPAFMQPDGIAVLDAFPLNANGKIHLSALPDPGHRAATAPDVPHEAPVGDTERHLAAVWQELLGITNIGRHDDFFALGGHSLMALRMFSRINREFEKSLPLAALILNPTIARLAELLAPPAAAHPKAKPLPTNGFPNKGHIVTLAEGDKHRPLFCIHGGDGGVIFYRGLAALMPEGMPFHAIESLELGNSGKIAESSIEETAAAYVRNILTIQPEGPFRLAGYSFGGVVAHEMACQLTEQGHKVEFLGMFDTHSPGAPVRAYSLPERLGVFWQQSGDQPLAKRISLLHSRLREGMHTHRTVRSEIALAKASGPADAYSDLRRVQVREENWRSMQAYRPRPFEGRITLFKTSFVNDKVERPADYGWSSVALSGLDIVSVSGHHLALFAPEHIGTLAEALTSSLKRSATSRT